MVMSAVTSSCGNKPGEPLFLMRIEAEGLKNGKITYYYRLGVPVSTEIKITNTTNERQSFKLKVTDNEIFKIKPVMGLIGVGETATSRITFNAEKSPENNRHFVAIYHLKCPQPGVGLDKKVKEFWAAAHRAEGVARILFDFKEEKSSFEKKK